MSVNLSGVDRDVKSDNISVNCIERWCPNMCIIKSPYKPTWFRFALKE
jgi:hypothetical protein